MNDTQASVEAGATCSGQGHTALSLEALRQAGAAVWAPIALAQLEALARRLEPHTGAVRQALQTRLDDGLRRCAEQVRQAQAAEHEATQSVLARQPQWARELRRLQADGDRVGVRRLRHLAAQPAAPTALVDLNRHIHEQAAASDGDDAPIWEQAADSRRELKSVRRFAELWGRLSAQDQVDQAVEQAPENAGPLNSHMLVLRSLGLMRQLSPDYLRRFVSQVDTWLWLEQAGQRRVAPAKPSKPPRRTRAAK